MPDTPFDGMANSPMLPAELALAQHHTDMARAADTMRQLGHPPGIAEASALLDRLVGDP